MSKLASVVSMAVISLIAGCDSADRTSSNDSNGEPTDNANGAQTSSSSSSSSSSSGSNTPTSPGSPTNPTTPTTPPNGGGTWWKPAPGTSWQWQLTGTIDTNVNASMFDIDLFTTSQATIDALHTKGKRVICYFSAGSHEPDRPDSAQFPAAVKGNVLDGWPDEHWLDVRSPTVRTLMQARLDVAVTKKCDGVEPDNVDGYNNGSGFPLTAADQLSFNKFLATEAHARSLSIALKNDLDQIPSLVGDFDFALNEQCAQYDECQTLVPFIQAGKAVFQVEYELTAATVCPPANTRNFDALIKNLDLDAYRVACR